MKTSKNLKFQIPELDDQANITVIGSALEALDDAAGDALAMNGDASSAQVTFTRADSRSNIESGSTFATIFAKISRYFADLKDAAFQSVANNLTTTSSGYVLDARQGKALNDSISKGSTQLGGLYFGQDSSGKWGYKTSANGTVNPFRNPVGTATAGDVLTGKTFANANADNVTGTMPNNGDLSKTLTPTGDNTVTYTIPAGYTSGGTVTASGSTAYAAGKSVAMLKKVASFSFGDNGSDGWGATVNIGLGMAGRYATVFNNVWAYRSGSSSSSNQGSGTLTLDTAYDSLTGDLKLTCSQVSGGISGGGESLTIDVYVISN